MGGRIVRVGWLALAVGPPAIAWAAFQHKAAVHPFAAVLIAAAYEGVILAARFLSGVAGDLETRWRSRLVERIDRSLSRIVSRFGGLYRRLVLEDLRYIDQKGLGTVGPFTPRLDEVFVDVSLAYEAPHQISAGLLSRRSADRPERRALSAFLDREKPVVLAVIGAPGSGKTTLLRNTARLACTTRSRRRKVPVLLYLRDHVAEVTVNRPPGLPDAVRRTLGDRATQGPAGWFEKRLAAGDCVVLLDGLDEVADSDDRRKVAAWVEAQIKRYPKNDYVITARPLGYQTAPISGALVLQALGFTSEQVNQFIRNWYLAAERFSAGEDSQHARQRAANGAADLLERLDKAPALYDLTTNPLLLTMIANVHLYRGQLPGSRAELYGEICQVMLWRRQEAKQLPVGLGPAREAVLRALAYDMMRERKRDVERPEVLERFGNALQRVAGGQTAEEFLADVSSSGLLVERDPGLYCFAHQTFQEYLAAAHIHDKGLIWVLTAQVNDDWWREATLLYVADADADPIVKACLESGQVAALALSFACAQEARDLDPSLRRELDRLLAEARALGTDPERRRLLTGILLIRHLDQQVTTQSGGRVCTRPISQSLYWLFLKDTGNPAPDGALPDTKSDAPAVGIRADDAAAFVRWGNGVIRGETAYRLPTRAEIRDRSAHRLLLPTVSDASSQCAWIEAEPAAIGLWIPPGARNPREISWQELARDTQKDIAQSTRDLTNLLLLRGLVAARLIAQGPEEYKLGEAAIARELERTLVRARSFHPGRWIGLDELVDHARALARLVANIESRRSSRISEPARGRGDARELAGMIATMLGVTAASGQFWSLVSPENDAGFAFTADLNAELAKLIGQGLSRSLAQAMRAEAEEAFKAEFSRTFCIDTGLTTLAAEKVGAADRPPFVITLERLARQLDEAVHDVLQLPDPDVLPYAWARRTAQRLDQLANPFLQRTERPAPAIIRACRLTALSLAAEVLINNERVAAKFHEVAAGLALLQQRASGDAPATEAILLARA